MSIIRIFAFGDSIVYGISDTDHSGWVDRLKQWANIRNETGKVRIAVFNLGVPGSDTEHLLRRFETETQERLVLGEDIYFIFSLGLNDLAILKRTGAFKVDPDSFAKNIQEIISQAKMLSPNIIFFTITPVMEMLANNPQYADKTRLNSNIRTYNQRLREICEKAGVKVLDIHDSFSQNTEQLLSHDGLHPNSTGHKVIFDTIKNFFENKI